MNRWLFWIVGLMALVAIANNFYTFYYKKNYDFSVEAPCDPQAQTCFVRDCSDGSCPPNNLSTYRVFHISAADFSKCTDDSCLKECTSGVISCQEDKCGASPDDTCSNQ